MRAAVYGGIAAVCGRTAVVDGAVRPLKDAVLAFVDAVLLAARHGVIAALYGCSVDLSAGKTGYGATRCAVKYCATRRVCTVLTLGGAGAVRVLPGTEAYLPTRISSTDRADGAIGLCDV
eukprot:3690831-Rhodomonas_salina.2